MTDSEQPLRSRRGRPPRYRREDILAGASTALVERGYGRLRYSDVSQAAGVPTASLQHYFPTVGELRQAALCFTVRDELAQLRRAVEELPTPWERVATLIRRSISPEPQLRRRNWTLWLEYWRAAAHESAIAADSREVGDAWNSLARDCIAAGVRDGSFRIDGTVDETAQVLQALLDGFGVNLAIEHTEDEAETATRLIVQAARGLLHVDH